MKITIDASPELMTVLNQIVRVFESVPMNEYELETIEEPQEEVKEEISKEETSDIDNPSQEDMRRVIARAIDKSGREVVQKAMASLGVERLSDLPVDKYKELIEKLENIKGVV